LDNNGGTGLKVLNGEVKFAQSHLTVIGSSSGNGVGIDMDRRIWQNQFSIINGNTATKKGFMLVTSGINTPINPNIAITDIQQSKQHYNIRIQIKLGLLSFCDSKDYLTSA